MLSRTEFAVAHRAGRIFSCFTLQRLRALSHFVIWTLVFCGAVFPASAQHVPPISVASYDFDGDGFEDGLFPVEFGDSPGEGWSRLDVYSVELGEVLFSLDPEGDASIIGRSVAVVGDVDGDGHDDILVGAPSAVRPDGVRVGAVTVYSGFDGAVLMQVGGYPGMNFGLGVAPAGDHNGDGWLDFAVTLVREVEVEGVIETFSEVHVYDTGTGECFAQYASGIAGDGFGAAVADLGDLDGDGHDDLAIASPLADAGAGFGAIHLFSGKSGSPGQPWFGGLAGASGTISGMGGPDLLFGVALVPIWDAANEEVTGLAVASQGIDGAQHELTEYSLGGAVITSRQFTRVFPAGDVDGSQDVDAVDLQDVVENIGMTEVEDVPLGVDLDNDGAVDVSDLSILVENFDHVGPLREFVGVGAASIARTTMETPACGELAAEAGRYVPCRDGSSVGLNPPAVDFGDGPNGLDDNGAGGNGWGNGGGTNPPGGGIDPNCIRPLAGCPDDFYINMPCDESETPLMLWFSSPWGSESLGQLWTISGGLSLDVGFSLADSAIRVVVNEPGAHFVGMTVDLEIGQNCGSSCNFEAVQRCIDLDIDSDNNNGYEIPEGTDEEDEVEDEDGIKLLVVNRGDVNDNGIPDYADGFGLFEEGGTDGDAFVPIVISSELFANGDDVVIWFDYDQAPPQAVSRQEIPIPDIESSYFEYSRGNGKLRIWEKNASASRSEEDFVQAGILQYLNDIEEYDSAAMEVKLYVEAVNGSATAIPITVTMRDSQGIEVSDTVLVLPFDAETGLDEDEIVGVSIFEGSTQGTPGVDVVLGTDGPDVIFTGDGDDIIVAGDGDDVIDAGAGADVVYAWAGYDNITLGGDEISGRSDLRRGILIRKHDWPDPSDALMYTYALEYGPDDLWMARFLSEAVGGKVVSRQPSWFTSRSDWDLVNRFGILGERYAEIQIEFDPNKPFDGARRLRKELIDCSIRWVEFRHDLEGHFYDLIAQGQFDEEDDPLHSLREMQDREFGYTAGSAAIIAGLYVSGIGVVSEGADIVITVHELSQGNVYAAVGFLPFVPATVVNGTKVTVKLTDASREIVKVGRVSKYSDHGLGWIHRSGMPYESYTIGTQTTFKLGSAQHTGGVNGDVHFLSMESIADQIIQSGMADYVVMNRSIRTCTGFDRLDIPGVWNKRPDLFHVDRDGVIHIHEVVSPGSQTARDMWDKIDEIAAEFPAHMVVRGHVYKLNGESIPRGVDYPQGQQ